MGRLNNGLRKIVRSPGVPQARHLAERSVTPHIRADVHQLGMDHGSTVDRLVDLELKVEAMSGRIDGVHTTVQLVESHQPTVLNAIASTNGTSRLLARETQSLRDSLSAATVELSAASAEIARRVDVGDEAVREEMRPHIHTMAWLLQRVETIRAEMMHELRYGAARSEGAPAVETKVINPEALESEELRLNLGAGHIAIDGYINVDMRELPGIDLVAAIDSLPFEPGSLTEISSSHTIEHFPDLQLRRTLVPYWIGLLRPGGTFRATVPDLESMSKAYVAGDMSFDVLRSVLYGGQEYDGDFHFTGFTPESLGALLIEAGLESPRVVAEGRRNGDCLEFEMTATKPSN